MRSLALVLLASAFWALGIAARAQESKIPQIGKDFIKQCSPLSDPEAAPASFEIGVCVGYILGTIDTLVYTQANIRSMPRLFSQDARLLVPVCIPSETKPVENVRVVLKWLDSHTDKLDYPIYGLTELALRDAFPCEASNGNPKEPAIK